MRLKWTCQTKFNISKPIPKPISDYISKDAQTCKLLSLHAHIMYEDFVFFFEDENKQKTINHSIRRFAPERSFKTRAKNSSHILATSAQVNACFRFAYLLLLLLYRRHTYSTSSHYQPYIKYLLFYLFNHC